MLAIIYFFITSIVVINCSQNREMCKLSLEADYKLLDVKVCWCEFIEITNLEISDQSLKFSIIDYDGNIESVRLEKTHQLVSRNTEVLIVEKASKFYQTTFEEFGSELINITMYGDQESAIVVYHDGNSFVVEGTVQKKVLRRVEMYFYKTLRYVYAQINSPGKCSVDNLHLKHNFGVNLEEINVKLMVVMDGDIINIENMESTEALKKILLYFTDIQLLFSRFQFPRIKFTIKKMIISRDNTVPFIGSSSFNMSDVLHNINKFAEQSKEEFYPNKYDLVIFLMNRQITNDVNGEVYNAVSVFEHKICDLADKPTIILSKYKELDYFDLLWILLFRFGVEIQKDKSLVFFQPFAKHFNDQNSLAIPTCEVIFNDYLRNDQCLHFREANREVEVVIVSETEIKKFTDEELEIYRYFVD